MKKRTFGLDKTVTVTTIVIYIFIALLTPPQASSYRRPFHYTREIAGKQPAAGPSRAISRSCSCTTNGKCPAHLPRVCRPLAPATTRSSVISPQPPGTCQTTKRLWYGPAGPSQGDIRSRSCTTNGKCPAAYFTMPPCHHAWGLVGQRCLPAPGRALAGRPNDFEPALVPAEPFRSRLLPPPDRVGVTARRSGHDCPIMRP